MVGGEGGAGAAAGAIRRKPLYKPTAALAEPAAALAEPTPPPTSPRRRCRRLEDVYAKFLLILETKIATYGVKQPRSEALAIMSMIEGESLFMGAGRRWMTDRSSVREVILSFVAQRYSRA